MEKLIVENNRINLNTEYGNKCSIFIDFSNNGFAESSHRS